MRLWWWRKIRKADMPPDEREVLERYGETVIQFMLSSEAPRPEDLRAIYFSHERVVNAANWVTERQDANEQREQRLETLEWAILLFVFLEVVHDFGALIVKGWHLVVMLVGR